MEINRVYANAGSGIHETVNSSEASNVLGFLCYTGKDCSPVQV